MKRVFDVGVSLLSLIVLSPLLVLVALVVRLKIGRPILFRQTRPGLHERPFTMVKFRTMREPRRTEERALTDAQRLSPVGRALRSTSLDELPELWNVLRGDMSIVGPRPLLMQYLPYFTEHERRRFGVRPGITGLAQINGRNAASWSDRFALDVRYVERHSLLGDVRIIAVTIKQIIAGSDVVTDARSTMLNLDEERNATRRAETG